MVELIEHVHAQLRRVFEDRPVILAGGVAAGSVRSVDELRRVGARRFLVVVSGMGTGDTPDGPDVEIVSYEAGFAKHAIEGFREEERVLEQPPDALRDAIERFDPARGVDARPGDGDGLGRRRARRLQRRR
jgi:hypothetical protein